MGILIVLIIVVGIFILIKEVTHNAEINKLRPIIQEGFQKGLSNEVIIVLLARDASRSVGRVLSNEEVDKIKSIVIEEKEKEQEKTTQAPQEEIGPRELSLYLQKNVSSILLQKNERAVSVMTAVGLREPRSVRITSGTYGGPSFRVAKGVYFRTGTSRSYSESHEELKDIDGGDFTITNQRIVFAGARKTINIPFKKIIGIEAFSNSLIVHKDGRERAQHFIWPENLYSITGDKLQSIIEEQLESKPQEYESENSSH